MKIFVIGMPQSGRTTVAQALANNKNYALIEAVSWMKQYFRPKLECENSYQYQEELHSWLLNQIITNPQTITDFVNRHLSNQTVSVIDGLFSPKDFTQLFDYNQDFVIFLNRINNEAECKDYENIGISVIRDYCFWLSSASLLNRERWVEFNFAIPGEFSDQVRTLGDKNTIYLVKNIQKVIQILDELII